MNAAVCVVAFLASTGASPAVFPEPPAEVPVLEQARPRPLEGPHETWRYPPARLPGPPLTTDVPAQPVCSQVEYSQGRFKSIQVNVDVDGRNIVGDVANEPSLAIDPNDRSRMIVGWRQFDTMASDFRQAGWAYSDDGGRSWAFPGVLQPGQFGSDPVVESDLDGNFYYLSLQTSRPGFPVWSCFLYKSWDGGATFSDGVYAYGGDKEWFVVDKTYGPGTGNIYIAWSPFASCCGGLLFTRSTDGGATFSQPVPIPRSPAFGTLAVAGDGSVWIVGRADDSGRAPVVRSSNAWDRHRTPVFDYQTLVQVGGETLFGGTVNPDGLLGQPWIACDRSIGPNSGNVYVAGSFAPPRGVSDPLDIHFVRSSDNGLSWSDPVRVNDDGLSPTSWQWFGTMSVAPGGRIDMVWYDTRNDPLMRNSQLYYASSYDGGETWSQNLAVSLPFAAGAGYPGRPMPQRKTGDYIQSVSDNEGVTVAYAATFNDEQDIYVVRIEPLLHQCKSAVAGLDCNGNGVADNCDIGMFSVDENRNSVPDECERDLDGDGVIDVNDPDIDGDGFFNLADACDYNDPGVPGLPPDGRPFGDVDASCYVDGRDYEFLHFCLANGGPDLPGALRICAPNFDADGDQDVDLFDAAMMLNVFAPSLE